MITIAFVLGIINIVMSAREVYYRETFKMKSNNIKHYWISIALCTLIPLMPLCDIFLKVVLCSAELITLTYIIENTHEAVDEGYYQYIIKSSKGIKILRPDKINLPFFCFEETFTEYLNAWIAEGFEE